VVVTGGDVADATGVGIVANGQVGSIKITGGSLLSNVSSTGSSIGGVIVKGGNVAGSLLAPNGQIGNVSATGVAVFVPDDPSDPQVGTGEVVGGNVLSPQIHAGAGVGRGLAIGTITMVGGGLGTDGSSVDVDADGDIGSLLVRSLTYKESGTREDVYDRNGDPVYDRNGNPVTRLVTSNAAQGGGIWVDLDTSGKLGDVTACGADLSGIIHAAMGMGTLTAQSIVNGQQGTWNGLRCVGDAGILLSNLSATLTAEPGAAAIAIKAITVNGGDFTSDVNVIGKVGKIATTGYADAFVDTVERTADIMGVAGGGFLSDSFVATSIDSLSLGGGDFAATVTLTGSAGNVTLAGGSFSGTLNAAAVGTITLTGLGTSSANKLNGLNTIFEGTAVSDFSGEVTAATTIGGLSVVAGNISQGSLTAGQKIGNVSLRATTLNAHLERYSDPDAGSWTEVIDGQVFGGDTFELTVHLTGIPANPLVRPTIGNITGTGAEVTVHATLPTAAGPAKIVNGNVQTYDPAGSRTSRFTISSTVVRYIQTYDEDYNPDTDTTRYIPSSASIGGVATVDITWT